MKHLLTLFALTGAFAFAESPRIPQCFKVNALIKMDADHYWADWTNRCPYTIDSVYVMVKFADKASSHVGNGVWALHFIVPGTHRVTRFSAPSTVPEFSRVDVRKITVNWEEALRPGSLPGSSGSVGTMMTSPGQSEVLPMAYPVKLVPATYPLD